MRVNVAPSGQARLVMRQRGNLRLLMNANLWAEMQVTKAEGGKVRRCCWAGRQRWAGGQAAGICFLFLCWAPGAPVPPKLAVSDCSPPACAPPCRA